MAQPDEEPGEPVITQCAIREASHRSLSLTAHSAATRPSPPLAGTSFPAFPYPPYDIQQQFMRALYAALDKGGVALFESPTGVISPASVCATPFAPP